MARSPSYIGRGASRADQTCPSPHQIAGGCPVTISSAPRLSFELISHCWHFPVFFKVFEDPWLRDPTCDVHIPSFSANWRKYRLKRKFKAAVLALVARDRMLNITFTPGSVASLQSRRSSLDSLPSDPTPLNRIRTSSLSGGGMTNLGAVQGDGIAGIDSLDMAVMGRGLSHALGDQPMSMSIDDIGFSERG